MARRHRSGCWPRRSKARRARCSRPISTSVRALNPGGELAIYPGSPALARALLRSQDRLIACEIEPNAAAALAHNLGRDRRVQGGRDRRLDRAQRLCAAAGAARRRPDRSAVRGDGRVFPPRASAGSRASQMGDRHFSALVPDQGPAGLRMLWRGVCGVRRSQRCCASRSISQRSASRARLGGCGLIVVNPPWTLADELANPAAAVRARFSRAAIASTGSRAVNKRWLNAGLRLRKTTGPTFPQPRIRLFL